MSMSRTEVNPRPAGGPSLRATSLWHLRVPRSAWSHSDQL